MLFADITILDENMESVENCYVATEDERITYIGKDDPRTVEGAEGDFSRVYEGKGRLLMSGFYNAHAHSPMCLMRGYGENLSLMDWLNTRIFPFENHLDSNAVYWGTMLGMAESFMYGIVSSSDMYYFCPDMAKAVIDSGAKSNISRSVANPTGVPVDELISIKETYDFISEYHNAANGKLKTDASIHAEYTSNPETVTAVAECAKKFGVISHVHVSETRFEHEECIKKYGKTPAAYLNDCGLFDTPALAAHCVYSTDEDLDIFLEKGVTVATNPVSNMKLASGILDASRVLDKGINLAIGTDSVASNNSLNFFEELKALAVGNKVRNSDPTTMTPKQILKAATYGGAKAQGRDDCGVLKVGNRADLIMIDISGPNMKPSFNIANNLVYSYSGSPEMTVVDGEVMYYRGEFTSLDIEKTVYEVEKATEGILKKL